MAIAALCAYSAALVWLARRAAGGRKGADGREGTDAARRFFVNDRAAGTVQVALSIIVSCVGASATLGVAGLAFRAGTPAFWWLGAGAAGLTLLAALLAEKVRRSGAYTMPQMTEAFLGRPARPLMAGIIVTAWMAILAAQFSALTRLLTAFAGLDGLPALGLAWLLIVAHTPGGQAAVLKTDRWQGLVTLGGLGLLLAGLWAANPGWTDGVRFEAVNDEYPAAELWRGLLVIGGNYLVCPMLFGRLLSARDSATARRAGFWAAGGLALASGGLVAIGLACRGLVPAGTADDAVLTTAMDAALPGAARLVVLLALVGVVVSSADSCLVTAATVFSHDLLRRGDPRANRACLVVLGLVGAGLTLTGQGILGFLYMAYDIYVGGVVMPVFIGLLARNRKKLDSAHACAAIAAGGLLGAAAALSGDARFGYAALGVSTLLSLAGLRPKDSADGSNV